MAPPALRTLSVGQSLGSYRVQSLLGAGGMGEVYRARDTRLDRDVAIKVLPQIFTTDAERLARFEREAKVLAALNHPNIAAIYGLERSTDVQALVLEFVDGCTVADLVARGPLPFTDVAPIAKQICEALQAAHEQGIVHRDLKPSNIKLRPDGTVKVLDFGLAKATDPPSGADLTHSPTITTPAVTRMGVIMGTAAYMSPEQAKGRQADKRSDIFAFGCVLYELLSGKRAFEGDDVAETLAAILRADPDWSALHRTTPPRVRRLLRRCLEKERRQRMADIDDVRAEIDEALAEGDFSGVVVADTKAHDLPRARRALWAAALASLLTVAAAAGWIASRALSGPLASQRLSIPVEDGRQIAEGPTAVLATSPDGRRLVYVAREGGRTRLFLRELDRFDTIAVPGSEGATAPFFSPDGSWIGFFAGEALQKVALRGGVPIRIADVPSVVSASWRRDDVIVFATAFSGEGLWWVAADGGTPEVLTRPNADAGESQHAYPEVLPDGKHLVFTVVGPASSHAAVFTTRTREWRRVPQVQFESGGALYVPTGHLLYAQAGRLVAVPFDVERAEPTGPALPLPERIASDGRSAGKIVGVSAETGTLVYLPQPGSPVRETLVILDREGRATPGIEIAAGYAQPRFSPDGQRLAVTVETEGSSDVWVYDLHRKTRTRLTTGGENGAPAWTPDGRLVAFHARRPGPWTLHARAADGSSGSEALLTQPVPPMSTGAPVNLGKLLPGTLPVLSGANPLFPGSWSSDGRTLAFTERKPSGEHDIWMVTMGDDPVPFLVTQFDESAPAFSPDGGFLAYVSDENGEKEVYVQSYPGPGGRWLISAEGGDDPVWSPDGRQLFYRRGDTLMCVDVQTRPAFSIAAQRRLFDGHRGLAGPGRNYDIAPDGRRFVMVRSETDPSPPRLNVVLNWFEELRRTSSAQ